MTRSLRSRPLRGLAALAAAALALAAPLRAQLPAAPAPAERLSVDGRRLRPQRLTYLLTLRRDTLAALAYTLGEDAAYRILPPGTVLLPEGAAATPATPPAPLPGDSLARPIGERTVTVAETMYGPRSAWAVSDAMRGPALASLDSLLVSRDDLAPMHWEATLGLSRLGTEFSRDSIFGVVDGPAVRRSIGHAGAPGLVANAASMELLLQLAPLHEGWRAELPILVVDLGGARVLPATASVEGVERVTVPAGQWECWVVVLRADTVEKRFWVRRDDPLVVRTTQVLPQMRGAVLESGLTGVVGR